MWWQEEGFDPRSTRGRVARVNQNVLIVGVIKDMGARHLNSRIEIASEH